MPALWWVFKEWPPDHHFTICGPENPAEYLKISSFPRNFKALFRSHPYCWWKKSCTTWDEWNLVNHGVIYQTQLVRPDVFHQGFSGQCCNHCLGNAFFSYRLHEGQKFIQQVEGGTWNPYFFGGVFHMNPCKSHVEPLYWGYFFVGTAAKNYAKYRPKWHTRVTATTWSLEPSLLYKDRPWQAKVSRLVGVKESFPTICWLLLPPPEKNSHLVFWTELTWKLTFL